MVAVYGTLAYALAESIDHLSATGTPEQAAPFNQVITALPLPASTIRYSALRTHKRLHSPSLLTTPLTSNGTLGNADVAYNHQEQTIASITEVNPKQVKQESGSQGDCPHRNRSPE